MAELIEMPYGNGKALEREFIKAYTEVQLDIEELEGIEQCAMICREEFLKMTTEKAIYQLTDLIKDRESFIHGDDDVSEVFLDDIESCRMGISALEKQMPKKVVNFMLNDGKLIKVFKGICPYCQCIVTNEYCSRCGQALDWSDSDE